MKADKKADSASVVGCLIVKTRQIQYFAVEFLTVKAGSENRYNVTWIYKLTIQNLSNYQKKTFVDHCPKVVLT